MALVTVPTVGQITTLEVDEIYLFLLDYIRVVGGTLNGVYYPPSVSYANLQFNHFDLRQEAEQGTVGTLVVPPLDGAVLAEDIVVTGLEVQVLGDFPAHLPGAGSKVYVVSAASHPMIACAIPGLAGTDQKAVSTDGYPAAARLRDLNIPIQRGSILRLAGVDANGAALSRANLDCLVVTLRFRADMQMV